MRTHLQTFPLATEQGQAETAVKIFFVDKNICPRACIGQRFARLELFTLLVKLVQTFKMEYAGEGEVGVNTRLVSHPDRKIKIKFTKRQ